MMQRRNIAFLSEGYYGFSFLCKPHTNNGNWSFIAIKKYSRNICILTILCFKNVLVFILFVEKGKPEVDYVTQVYEYSKCRSIIIQISIFALYIYEI